MRFYLHKQRNKQKKMKAKMQLLNQIKAIYDNGGTTLDRYTIYLKTENNGFYDCLCMSLDPTHPLGFSQFSTGQLGKHNGTQIKFNDLPANIQAHFIDRLS